MTYSTRPYLRPAPGSLKAIRYERRLNRGLILTSLYPVGICLILLLTSGPAAANVTTLQAAEDQPLIQRVVSWWQKKILPHERYAKQLRKADGQQQANSSRWLTAANEALKQPYSLSTAHAEFGQFSRNEIRADGYLVTVKKGQKLAVELTAAENFDGRLFVDLFQRSPVVPESSLTALHDSATLPPEYNLLVGKVVSNRGERQVIVDYVPEHDGQWLLRLQPALLTNGNYKLRVTVEPLLGFPVQNAGNSAARSFFGADRDAGRRRHHGVDIFAARHTPVVAVADGVIVQVSRSPRGGLHIWLRDRQRSAVYYYAHLESASVSRGQRVSRGEVLGTVGNSGNARTTAPHLHFGLYSRGPIDPWPYIRQIKQVSPAGISQGRNVVGQQVEFNSSRSAKLRLRSGPGTRFSIRDQLRSGSRARVLAASKDWLKIQTDDGLLGWASANYLEPIAGTDLENAGRNRG